MKQTKIDWCDCTINPVVGCKNNCPYCYARKMNARFKWVENFDKPEFFPERLKQLACKSPKTVFIDSMSDCAWWSDYAWELVIEAIRCNPQHRYIFLTKCPAVYARKKALLESVSDLVFLGTSITNNINSTFYFDNKVNCFLSIEPLLKWRSSGGSFSPFFSNGRIKQVIIGAETGNRKEKVVPKVDWVRDIVESCDKNGVAVFMKESLRELMGDEFRQDRLIWEIRE